MYHYDLIVTIFSKDENLEKIIKEVTPLPNYSHIVTRYDNFSRTLFQMSDIAILDDGDFDYSDYAFDPEVKCIFCADRFKEKYSIFSSVLTKPIDYKQFKYEFEKVLKTISDKDEYIFTKNCLNSAINGMPDMFWIKSLDGIHTLLNDKFCEVVDKPKNDITGKDHYYIWNVSRDDPNSGADICKQTEDAVIAKRNTLSFYETVKSKQGVRQLVTYKSPLYDKYGSIIGTVGIGHDITDLKNLGIENRILIDSVPYAMLIKNKDGIIENVNNNFLEYFDVTEADVLDHNYEKWAESTFNKRFDIKNDYTKEGAFEINGEEKEVELRFKNILNAFGDITGQIGIFRDITIERKLQKQLEQSSNIDFLTGLYNRRFLREYISSLNNGENLTLITLDLDHFKYVNDTYGHKKGDDALIITSKTLKELFSDDLVFRMGGDEFLIVKVGKYDLDELKLIGQSILDNLSNQYQCDEELNTLSSSVGISQGILVENEFSELLHKSDQALYQAKDNGRSCFVISGYAPQEIKTLTKKPK